MRFSDTLTTTTGELMIEILISVDKSSGLLNVVFSNSGDRPIVLRQLYEPHDVIIENEQGLRAEYYLSFPYGADVETFSLKPREKFECAVNLATDFVYPQSGNYRAWIDYDSNKDTAKYAKADHSKLRLVSNVVEFPIELPANA